jgi:beta-glucosidase
MAVCWPQTELIRDEMKFGGMIVTDWAEINNQFSFHRTANSKSEAARLALTETSIDMSMVPSSPGNVKWGNDTRAHLEASPPRVRQLHIDAAAGRVLQLKKDLGLLQDPFLDSAAPLIKTVGQQADRDVAKDIARESLVLLENEQAADGSPTLPLRPQQHVFLTGPAIDSRRLLSGGWTLHWQGPVDDSETEFPHQQETIKSALSRLHRGQMGLVGVTAHPGIELAHGKQELVGTPSGSKSACVGACASQRGQALKQAAAPNVDVIVLVFGEESYAEKPGDIDDQDLPKPLRDYATALIATGKPVVAVLVEGRPRLLRGCLDGAKAVVWAGLPGPEGGVAISELLQGVFSPSGRLPITYPKSGIAGGNYYWHKHSHQCNGVPCGASTAAMDCSALGNHLDRFPHWCPAPSRLEGGCYSQWDFAQGKHYTTITYSNLQLSATSISAATGSLTATVTVANTGTMDTKHSVLLFLSQEFRRISPELKLLKRFQKITIAAGASQTIVFELSNSDFAHYGVDVAAGPVVEPGKFTARVGQQPDCHDPQCQSLHPVTQVASVIVH